MKSKPIKLEQSEEMEFPMTLDGVTADKLPEIKKWEVGESYTLEVKVEMTGIRKSPYEKDAEIRADFKILDIKNLGNTSKLEKLNEKLS